MSGTIIYNVKQDGTVEIQLGEGWPPGTEAADVADQFLGDGFEVTRKSHKPHDHVKRPDTQKVYQ
jgi:hypothetical protein